jgi:hypothetical protein
MFSVRADYVLSSLHLGQVLGQRICIGGHVAVRVEVLGNRKISFHLVRGFECNKGERANKRVNTRTMQRLGDFGSRAPALCETWL